tara:strand:+ start:488 stop:1552 length:1065 start_codon:yes stop_codon:yes gene_type:complete
LFLSLQEYYRQIENHNLILKNYINDKTPQNIKVILKICLTLLFHSEKPHFAIVNEAVEFSKKFKKHSLVNAVLRGILRSKNNISINSKNIPNIFKKCCDDIFLNEKITLYIIESCFRKPQNYQISISDKNNSLYEKRVFYLEKELEVNSFIQDIGNFEIIKSVIKIYKDKNILDICAAPGGKSILLHSYGFKVNAIDKSQRQIDKFIQNINRMKLNIKISKKDFLRTKFAVQYNSILLDAPCSALGTYRRNPDVISKIDEKKLKLNQKSQIEMIEKSLNLLNKSGVLVYIVCSFHPFETMDVIDKILQKHKTITVENIQSNKMIKKENGYFINPYSFKDFGGSDIFFVTALKKN